MLIFATTVSTTVRPRSGALSAPGATILVELPVSFSVDGVVAVSVSASSKIRRGRMVLSVRSEHSVLGSLNWGEVGVRGGAFFFRQDRIRRLTTRRRRSKRRAWQVLAVGTVAGNVRAGRFIASSRRKIRAVTGTSLGNGGFIV